MKKRHLPIAAAAVFSAAITSLSAQAQQYPVDTVTMIVPYAAGGAGDIVGRLVADELAQRLGVTFVVENVGGAGGAIGAEQVSRSPADGSVLLLAGNAIFTTAPHLSDVGFDPFEDFTAIANVSEAVRMLVASKTLPVASIDEFVAYGKEHPGELNYGSVGVGSTGHVATVDMLNAMGIEAVHIAYGGASEVVQGVLAGDIQFMMDAAAIPQARQGSVTPLAVPGPDRIAEFPDLPALGELGYNSISGTGWQMVMAPGGLDPAVALQIQGALEAASTDQAFIDKLTKAGVSPRFMPGDALEAALRSDHAKYETVLSDLGLAKK